MSRAIDQKVVEMRFDNAQFEKNVSTTMNSLDKLQKSLDMTGATKGLENVESAARKCDVSGIGSAVDAVKMKFSALEVMGITALTNITNSAVNAGKRIVSALTIDPVKAGFSEYELKMNSIQTIMAATGADLEDVTNQLNELNKYSDQTIYSFSDMTSNIGKFTNAGVSLEDSVAAIKGVANVAAVSGANSNEAARSMYNFAQALSSGYVKLIDWKSIELANMATVEFKEQLIESAVAAGTLTKAGDGMYTTLEGKTISATKNFNDSLQDQWMTTEVLLGTLKKYTDENTEIGKKAYEAATQIKTITQLYDVLKETAQSGWAQTWETIVGDFDEAKEFMTYLNEQIGGVISASAESRNEMLENWKVLGGRTALLESVKNIFEGIKSVIAPIRDAFRDIFPPMTAERLLGFSEGLRNLTERLIISDETADKLKRTFKGVFAIVDIAKTIFVALVNAVGSLLGPTETLSGGILGVTASIGDLLVGVSQFIKRSNIFGAAFQFIAKIIGGIISLVGKIAGGFGDILSIGPIKAILSLLDGIQIELVDVGSAADDMWESVSGALGKFGEALEGTAVFRVFKSLWNLVKTLASGVMNVLGGAFDALADAFGGGDFEGFFAFIDAIIGGAIGIGLVKIIKKIGEFIGIFGDVKEKAIGLLDSIDDIFSGLTGTLKSFQHALNAAALKQIATAVLMLVGSLFALTLIDRDKLSSGLAALTILITELTVAMSMLGGSNMKFWEKNSAASGFGQLASAILLLVIPLAILANIDSEKLKKGILAITILISELAVAMRAMNSIDPASACHTKFVTKIAWAMVLLAIPMKLIGSMDWASWGRGLMGITVLMGVLVGAMAIMSKIKTNGVLRHVGLLSSIAWALTLLAVPMRVIGSMDWASWGRGLIGITVLLGEMIITLALLSKIKTNGVLRNIAQLTTIAGALIMLTIPLAILSLMSWDAMKQGLIGVGIMLGGMITALALISFISNKTITGTLMTITQLITIAGAILMLTVPLLVISSMDWDKMWQGLAGLGVILGGLIVALGLMAVISKISTGGVMVGIGAVVAMAGAILLLTPALIALSLVPIISLVKAIGAIAIAFTVLGIAGLLLEPLAGAIMTLSLSMLAFGAGVLLAGAGVAAFGVGLSLVAVGITALVGAFGLAAKSLDVIVAALVGIIAGVIEGIGKGIVAFFKVLTDSMGVIEDFLIAFVELCCAVLVECAPKLVNAALQMIVLLLKGIEDAIPSITKSLANIILLLMDGLIDLAAPLVEKLLVLVAEIIKGLANGLKPLVSAVVDLFMAFVDAVLEALGAMDSTYLMDALKNVGMLTLIVAGLAATAALTPAAMIGVVGLGLVITELVGLLTNFALLAQIPGIDWVIREGGDFLEKIGTAIGKFIGGIAGGIAQGFSSSLPSVAEDLSDFMEKITPFIDGAKAIDESALTGVRNLANMIVTITGTALLEKLTSWLSGGSNIAAFSADLALLGAGLAVFSREVADVSSESVSAATTALTELANMTAAIPNSGGIFSWFTGDNNISEFAVQLPLLGLGLKGFSAAVTGIDTYAVSAAANALTSLAEMANVIPNSGGLFSWFTGDNDISSFSAKLPLLGLGLKAFSAAVVGIDCYAVKMAASAAKDLAEMSSVIPNTGGLAAWFAGENSVANFAEDLKKLGRGLKGFAETTAGITEGAIGPAASAAKSLAEMTSYIPKSEGIVAWFTGETNIAAFADKLPILGKGLKGFSDAVTGIVPENMTAAATAGKALAEMTSVIPKSEGITAWFTGETNIADFADKLPILGKGIKGFSDSVNGVVPENITSAANAAKALGEMTDVVPKNTNKIISFGENLVKFGSNLKSYFDATKGITAESATATTNIVNGIKDVANINVESADGAANAITKLTNAIKGTAGIKADSTNGFVIALKNLGKISADAFVKSFEDITTKMKDIGFDAVEAFVKGVKDNTKTAKTAAETLIDDAATAASESVDSFETSGKNLVQGFANGIALNKKIAADAARAMAAAAAEAAKAELDEHSPSKVGYGIGDYFGIAFANAISDNAEAAYDASAEMASGARHGLMDAIGKIADVIDSDIDSQPTIRPVLDLSGVESGVGRLNGMFGLEPSVGVLTNIGAISSGMSRNGRNGSLDDVVRSVDKLGDKLDNTGNTTYIIDGVTYDDGSAVANAVEEIVHAAVVERRT